MSKVSTAQKAAIVARVAGQQVKRSKIFRASKSAAWATGRAFGKVLHQLWLEVTGLVFLIMSLSGAGEVAHEYAKYQQGKEGFGRVAIAICFTVTFAWFGVSSFWKVKRKGKSGT